MRLKLWIALLMVLLLNAPWAGAAPYYQGKTITIVVGYKPGGGYDRYARLLSRHLPKYIPGNPTVIVENMPGASSVIAANHLYSIAKPDGLTFGTFNNATVIAQLIKVEGVKFDLSKFSWLGSAASDAVILTVRSDLPYKSASDLRKAKEFVIGTTGPGSSTHDFPTLLREFAGFDFKLVPGYSSSSDVMLAVERKEVDGRAGSYDSIKPFIDRGLVRPVLRNRTSAPGIEIPTQIYRPFVAPPGTPKDVMKILREAFANVLKDKELLAEAKKGKMTIDYTSPDDALKVINEVLSQPPDVVKELTKYIRFGE
jgi:tripartite-type tricarboxylate transporter receptor subunit TctC